MKNLLNKFIKIGLIAFVIIFITSCNPFGKYSQITFKNPLNNLLNKPVNADLNSGGEFIGTTPLSGGPSSAHKIKYSVGSPYKQNLKITANGSLFTVELKGQ